MSSTTGGKNSIETIAVKTPENEDVALEFFLIIMSSIYLLKSSSSLAIWVPMLPAYIIVPGVLEMPGMIGGDFLQSNREKAEELNEPKGVQISGLQPHNVYFDRVLL